MAAGAFARVETPRLRLVPVSDADPEEVAARIGNYDVARWLGRVPYPYDPDAARAFIAANRDQAGRVWFIRDAEGLVGGISIDGELGYWIARAAWGRGYATEAGDAVTDVHFADPAAGDLTALHYPGNARSAAVLKKLGFRYSGRRRVQALALAQSVDSHTLCLPRAVWRARRALSLTTARLDMRPLRDADWQVLQAMGGVPEVARMMLSLTAPWPEAAVRHWIATSRFRGRPGYRLGVSLKDGRLIGVVGFGPDLSVSYMLDRRHWGRGLMTEALRAFLGDVFARFPEVDGVIADHFADNPASGAVLRKLGFAETGVGQGRSQARLEPAANVHYRLSRDRFGRRP